MVTFNIEVHPGEILRDQLAEVGLSANAAALRLGVPANRITDILKARRGITADTALRLGLLFNQTPEFWLNLQHTYDLVVARRLAKDALARIVPLET